MKTMTIAKGAVGTALAGLGMGILAMLKARKETSETEVVDNETTDVEVVDNEEEES